MCLLSFTFTKGCRLSAILEKEKLTRITIKTSLISDENKNHLFHNMILLLTWPQSIGDDHFRALAGLPFLILVDTLWVLVLFRLGCTQRQTNRSVLVTLPICHGLNHPHAHYNTFPWSNSSVVFLSSTSGTN